MLRLDSTLEETTALLRLAIRLDVERTGLDVQNMVAWSFGRHMVDRKDLQNDEEAEKLAKSRLVDAVLTYALIQLRAMQKQKMIDMSKTEKQIVRQVRNYLAHPEARIAWEETNVTASPAGSIQHQGIIRNDEIRDVHFGYAVGILQLLVSLQTRTAESVRDSNGVSL